MGSMFLQVTDATVLLFDLKGFANLAARLGPIELGAALGRFYEHAEAVTLAHGGRVVKFVGDLVYSAWLTSEAEDHRRDALAALADAHGQRRGWVQAGVDAGLPILDYTMAAATGSVLVGQIGTARLRTFDVLGEPVSTVRKLTMTAAGRGVDHLITADTLELAERPAAIEVEPIELGDRRLRLYRME